MLDFGGHVLSAFTCGMTVDADRTTYAGGSEGYVVMDTPWFSDGTFTRVRGDDRETIRAEASKDPYALEAEAFAFAAAAYGEAKPWISQADTLGNVRVLAELRRQVGLPF